MEVFNNWMDVALHGVDMVVLGQRLDLMILQVFSNLNDFIILIISSVVLTPKV